MICPRCKHVFKDEGRAKGGRAKVPNGIKDDNRPENLELWASNHPAGQRVADIVKHAEDVLKLYWPDRLNAAAIVAPAAVTGMMTP